MQLPAHNGKRIHDANVAATMTAHGIRVLVTQNPGDFTTFLEIEVVAPAEVTIRP